MSKLVNGCIGFIWGREGELVNGCIGFTILGELVLSRSPMNPISNETNAPMNPLTNLQ